MDKNLQVYLNEVIDQTATEDRQHYGACVGQVIRIDSSGEVFVDFPGNTYGPIAARLALANDESLKLRSERCDSQVLLVFENNNLRLPIIVGLVSGRLERSIELETKTDKNLEEIIINGDKVILDAKEEIILCCGKSSMILKKDGKIVMRGTDLISRASHCNRIRGVTVKIN